MRAWRKKKKKELKELQKKLKAYEIKPGLRPGGGGDSGGDIRCIHDNAPS